MFISVICSYQVTCELLEERPNVYNYTFKATFKRDGQAAEEILFDYGSLTIYRGEDRTHHKARGSTRLGTSIIYVVLKLELETVNGQFRLDSKASKIRKANGNQETICMQRTAAFF